MPWISGAIAVGGSLLGGMMAGDAAGEASAAQAGASREQIAESRRQFEAIQKLLMPYAQTGTDALSQQRALLGLGALPSGGFGGGVTAEQLRTQLLPQFTTGTAGGGQYVPMLMGGGSDAGTWTEPVWQAGPAQTIDETGLQAAINQQLQAQSQGQQAGMGTADQQQAAAVAKFENSPYYQAITKQAENAILQNSAATGGLRGGNIQGALSSTRPILLQNLIDKQLANLSGLTSIGQNAAAGVGNAGMQTGTQVNQALGQMGAAQAGGILGQSNATIGALGNVGGLFAQRYGGNTSLFAPPVIDDGYSVGQGSAYGGTRAGL